MYKQDKSNYVNKNSFECVLSTLQGQIDVKDTEDKRKASNFRFCG